MSLRPGITLESLNQRGRGRLPDLFGFRVMALEQGCWSPRSTSGRSSSRPTASCMRPR